MNTAALEKLVTWLFAFQSAVLIDAAVNFIASAITEPDQILNVVISV